MLKKLILGALVLTAGAWLAPQQAEAHGPFGPSFGYRSGFAPMHYGYRYGHVRSYRHPAYRYNSFRHPGYMMPGPSFGIGAFGHPMYGHPMYGPGFGRGSGFSLYFGR